MPHFKDGRSVRMFDRVRAPTGTRHTKDAPPEKIYSDALVIGIYEGQKSCELIVLVGSGKCMGTVNLPQFCSEDQAPRAGVVLDGYWTNCNAKDCTLIERES